jgi:phospholipid/cholesterol/gamma-HCH transport system substrate-binding protein
MDEIKQTVSDVNEQHVIDDVKVAIQNFSDTFHSMQDALEELKTEEVFANAGSMMRSLKDASQNVEMITADISEGKGTIGRLIKGEDFYLQMTAVMSKVDTLMNDINHYGLLFYLNKSWQRQRSQRMTALNALDTPINFKQYFETEVDDINMAMSRISMLIDKAQLSPEKEEILSDEQFRKDFAELLRQADTLSDNLKLYNQQLMEASQ